LSLAHKVPDRADPGAGRSAKISVWPNSNPWKSEARARRRRRTEALRSVARQKGRQGMAITTKYLFIVSMDVAPDKEALFNEVYDGEHVPNLMQVPGVISVTRLTVEPLTVSMGGERRTVVAEGEPHYAAIYEIEGPQVLVSDAWAAAVEAGRWPREVRPYTRNRRHAPNRGVVGRLASGTRVVDASLRRSGVLRRGAACVVG